MTLGAMTHPVSKILRTVLIELGVGMLPIIGDAPGGTEGSSSDWPIYVTQIPDTPDNLISIHDTTGVQDGRAHANGKRLTHPGIMITIRGDSHQIAFAKSQQIQTALDETIIYRTVEHEEVSYLLHNISITSGPNDLGKELDVSRRNKFTINALASINQI